MHDQSEEMLEPYLGGNYDERIAFGRALWAYVSASTWNEALCILRRYRHMLVTPVSIGMLSGVIRDLRATQTAENALQADHWEVHLLLVEDALRYGVDEVLNAVRDHLSDKP